MNNDIKIAVIGLGYVGLPLARLFATKYPVIGFDINAKRVEELQKGHDSTLEVEDEVLQAVLLKKYPLPIEMPAEVEEFAIAGHWNKPTRLNGSSEEAKPTTENRQPTTGLYIHNKPRRHPGLQLLHHHRSHSCGQEQPPRPYSAVQIQRKCRESAEERRHCDL